MRHKAHLIRSAAGPVLRSITPRPQKGDRWTASVIQGVVQRDFRIQHLRNRATRFGFIDDLIEGRFINAWQRNGAGSVLHLWRAAADTLGCDDLGLTG